MEGRQFTLYLLLLGGIYFGQIVWFKDQSKNQENEIIVQNNNKGKPNIKLIGQTKIIVSKIIKKRFKILLTLSDDKPFAIATVIISL